MLLPLLLLSALSVSARPVAITGEDGTTRLVDIPAAGTNWIGVVGVDFSGNIVTNEALWMKRREAREGAGVIEWADGTRSHFRIPKPGKTVAVTHEIKILGKGNKRTRLVEVLWIDHEGNTVSNAIGRAAQLLPFRPAFDKARQEHEDKAIAAAKRRPNPDSEDRIYISSRDRIMRQKRKGMKPAKMQRPSKPAASKREAPDEGADKVLEEYRAKAEENPSHVEKKPGR
jgi:hypothetical protein